MIVLKKEDFDIILKSTLAQLWDEVQEAMKKLVYFDQWDNLTVRECCILSKIKTYEPNQIILGDGVGQRSQMLAYFIIEGTAKIIEHLLIQETVHRGIKSYKLYEKDSPQNSVSQIPKVKKQVDGENQNEASDQDKGETETIGAKLEDSRQESNYSLGNMHYSENIYDFTLTSDVKKNQKKNLPSSQQIATVSSSRELVNQENESDEKLKLAVNHLKPLPPNVKLQFIEICTLGEKATFSDGVLMKNRRVVASTSVKCLIIPTYWLLQHNKGNIWTRIEQYYSSRIPSTRTVFNAYVNNQKWKQYRRQIRNDAYMRKQFPSNTTIHDVPYSIRIASGYD